MYGLSAASPLYSNVYNLQSNQNSNYNGMQVTVEKRLTHHVSAKGSYTWSHTLASNALDGTLAQQHFVDPNYPQLEKQQRSDQDRRNMVSASVVWKPDYFSSYNRPVRTRIEWLDIHSSIDDEQRPALHRNNRRGQLLQRPGTTIAPALSQA